MSHNWNWILPDGSNWIVPDGNNYITPEPVLHLAVPKGHIAWVPWSEVTAFVEGHSHVVYVAATDSEVEE